MPLPIDRPPAFFRRVWNAPMSGPLVIFGRYSPSPYVDDAPREAELWGARGAFPAECFSIVEPEGEYGLVGMAEGVLPISEEEFEAARARGWRP